MRTFGHACLCDLDLTSRARNGVAIEAAKADISCDLSQSISTDSVAFVFNSFQIRLGRVVGGIGRVSWAGLP